MTELERFAAMLLNASLAEGVRPEAALSVGAILDRTFPYKVARRSLSLETSEDYEAMLLRLVSEEGELVVVSPGDAAEMARSTLASRVPDLDVVRLLRNATLTFTDDALSRLQGVRVLPVNGAAAREIEPTPAPKEDRVFPIRRGMEAADATRVASANAAAICWSCGASLPTDRPVNFCVACGVDQREPRCDGCGAAVERGWKHCPDCGTAL